jgi:hypothetical protein
MQHKAVFLLGKTSSDAHEIDERKVMEEVSSSPRTTSQTPNRFHHHQVSKKWTLQKSPDLGTKMKIKV